MSLLSLPHELMLHVLSFLDFRDVLSCSLVCNSMNKLSKDELYWKSQCKVHWDQETCLTGFTWKEYFIQWYNKFGCYFHKYKQVRKAWNQIESFVSQNCPEVFNSLNVGATEEELNFIEDQLKLKLPSDLRCIYRIHNGQKTDDDLPVAGLFGTIHNYGHFRNERMIPLEEILSLCSAANEKDLGLIRISFCDYSGVSSFLCVSEHAGFELGSIYCPAEHPTETPLSEKSCFILGESYLQLFSNYARDLANTKFPLVNHDSQVFIYKFYQEPGCVAVTDHVRVGVATAFIPEMSSVQPPRFTFAYRITMSMGEDVDPRHSCQLETRHWIINDGRGVPDHVDGPGVIGDYPIMKPGSTYSYVSCTNFKTLHGQMKGTYTFRKFATSQTSEIVVPEFHMSCPPFLNVKERKKKIGKEKN